MLLWKILGTGDIIAAISLILYALGFPLYSLQAFMAIILIGKGIFFFGDLFSVFDFVIGIAMLAMIWVNLPILATALGLWLGFKGVYSYA